MRQCQTVRLWCDAQALSDRYCFSFDKSHASRFMRDTDSGGRLSPKTYNNYLRFFSTLFLWMANKGYAYGNPFDGLERKRVEAKQRDIVPPDDCLRILSFFREKCPDYVYIMMLCYKYFIRPKEILMLKIQDINFDEGLVTVPPSVAKNHKERTVALADDVMGYLRTLQACSGNLYVFSEGYKPGLKLMNMSIWKVIFFGTLFTFLTTWR